MWGSHDLLYPWLCQNPTLGFDDARVGVKAKVETTCVFLGKMLRAEMGEEGPSALPRGH